MCYLLKMASNITSTFPSCLQCCKRRLRLIGKKQNIFLFSATKPLKFDSVHDLDSLCRSNAEHWVTFHHQQVHKAPSSRFNEQYHRSFCSLSFHISLGICECRTKGDHVRQRTPIQSRDLLKHIECSGSLQQVHFELPLSKERPCRAFHQLKCRDNLILRLRSPLWLGLLFWADGLRFLFPRPLHQRHSPIRPCYNPIATCSYHIRQCEWPRRCHSTTRRHYSRSIRVLLTS